MRRLIAVLFMVFLTVFSAAASGNQKNTNEIDCLECHNSVLAENKGHFPQTGEDCRFCHKGVMRGDIHDISINADDLVCISCHFDGPGYSQNPAHNDIMCVNCHCPHGCGEEYMISAGVIETCTESCHNFEDIGISHPVGHDTADRNTGMEITCVSTCHGIHAYREPKLLQLSSTRLCQCCHAEKF
ncbi:MAG: hypothetical protein JSW64_15110 [Candidatus Zixiibacteriota bacterium]|nr:MAG: hypothetical protein JSW64_15110 [candidate division Zixibacteria bacterium]